MATSAGQRVQRLTSAFRTCSADCRWASVNGGGRESPIAKSGLAAGGGELVAVVGPNGAGKSTMFNLITGVLPLGSGEVRFRGERIDRLSSRRIVRRGIARTFQIVQPFAAQTVRENIAVGAHLHLPQRALALARAEEVALQVGLGPQLDKLASDLTVAGRKRLEMARALAARPKLLLLDEPLEGLAPIIVEELLKAITRVTREEGMSVIIVEQHPQAILAISHQAVVLDHGTVVHTSDAQTLRQQPELLDRLLGVSRH